MIKNLSFLPFTVFEHLQHGVVLGKKFQLSYYKSFVTSLFETPKYFKKSKGFGQLLKVILVVTSLTPTQMKTQFIRHQSK